MPSDNLWRGADIAFAALWVFVIAVSVFDGYLVLTNRQYIGSFELNPVGQFLLRLNGGDVWLLLAAKTAGTVLACTVVLVLYWWRVRMGLSIAAALATCQFALLVFLLTR